MGVILIGISAVASIQGRTDKVRDRGDLMSGSVGGDRYPGNGIIARVSNMELNNVFLPFNKNLGF